MLDDILKLTFTYRQFLRKSDVNRSTSTTHLFISTSCHGAPPTPHHGAGNCPKLYHHWSPCSPLPSSLLPSAAPSAVQPPSAGAPQLQDWPSLQPAQQLPVPARDTWCASEPWAALLPECLRRSRHWPQTLKSWAWVRSPPLPNCVSTDTLFVSTDTLFHLFQLPCLYP